MNRTLSIARYADLALGVGFVLAAAYCVSTQAYLMAGVWVASAVLSFISVKVVPARWVAKRILLARLKA